MVAARQPGNRIKGFLIVTQEFGHGSLRPNHKVDLVGQRLFRKLNQLLEPFGILACIPNQGLRNAGLHQRYFNRARLGGRLIQLAKTEIEKNRHRNHGNEYFSDPY